MSWPAFFQLTQPEPLAYTYNLRNTFLHSYLATCLTLLVFSAVCPRSTLIFASYTCPCALLHWLAGEHPSCSPAMIFCSNIIIAVHCCFLLHTYINEPHAPGGPQNFRLYLMPKTLAHVPARSILQFHHWQHTMDEFLNGNHTDKVVFPDVVFYLNVGCVWRWDGQRRVQTRGDQCITVSRDASRMLLAAACLWFRGVWGNTATA